MKEDGGLRSARGNQILNVQAMGLRSGGKTNRSDAGMNRDGDAIADLHGAKQELRNQLLSDGKSYEEEYSHDYDVKSGDMGGM